MKAKFTQGLLDEEMIIKSLKIIKGQKILDVGCGNGYMSKRFSEIVGNSGNIYALDTDKVSIDILRREILNPNLEALTGDITKKTIFQNEFFDLVYLSTVIHIFSKSQIERFCEETKRILKPKFQLAIVNFKKEDVPFGPPVDSRLSPDELAQRLSFTPGKCIEAGKHFYMQIFLV